MFSDHYSYFPKDVHIIESLALSNHTQLILLDFSYIEGFSLWFVQNTDSLNKIVYKILSDKFSDFTVECKRGGLNFFVLSSLSIHHLGDQRRKYVGNITGKKRKS